MARPPTSIHYASTASFSALPWHQQKSLLFRKSLRCPDEASYATSRHRRCQQFFQPVATMWWWRAPVPILSAACSLSSFPVASSKIDLVYATVLKHDNKHGIFCPRPKQNRSRMRPGRLFENLWRTFYAYSFVSHLEEDGSVILAGSFVALKSAIFTIGAGARVSRWHSKYYCTKAYSVVVCSRSWVVSGSIQISKARLK